MLCIFATLDPERDRHSAGSWAIGLAVMVAHLTSVSRTGTGINPARSFGPAVITGGSSADPCWKDHWGEKKKEKEERRKKKKKVDRKSNKIKYRRKKKQRVRAREMDHKNFHSWRGLMRALSLSLSLSLLLFFFFFSSFSFFSFLLPKQYTYK